MDVATWSRESVDEVNEAVAERDPIFLYTIAFNDKELGHALKAPARAKERYDYRHRSVRPDTVKWHSVEMALVGRLQTMIAQQQQSDACLFVDPEIHYRHVAICAFAAVRSGQWQVRFGGGDGGDDDDLVANHLDGCTAVETGGFVAVSWRHLTARSPESYWGSSVPSREIEDAWCAAFPRRYPHGWERAVEQVVATTSGKEQCFLARTNTSVTYEPALVIQRQKLQIGIAQFLYLLFHQVPKEGAAAVPSIGKPRIRLSTQSGDLAVLRPEDFINDVRDSHVSMEPVAAAAALPEVK